jgi:predicted DNA-binding transcriptional regulator YafY
MSRSERLFRLLQAFRTLPSPVTALQLAEETGVSLRSIYRDVDTLRASGAKIEGERGYGYRMIEDGTLPPQAFSRIEIEALVLGLAEVKNKGDHALSEAASAVLGKVAATLPSLSQQHILHAVSKIHRHCNRYPVLPDMQIIRDACWSEHALKIRYTDKAGVSTSRTILPLAIIYTDDTLVLLAHCCLRDDFRMFRLERIASVENTDDSFRPNRASMLQRYLQYLRAL